MILSRALRQAKTASSRISPGPILACNGKSQWRTIRPFSTSPRSDLAVSELTHEQLASLRINRERLMNDIHTTCEWGKGEPWGEYVMKCLF